MSGRILTAAAATIVVMVLVAAVRVPLAGAAGRDPPDGAPSWNEWLVHHSPPGELLGVFLHPHWSHHCHCRSKQSEAKTNLSGIFTAQHAYSGVHGTFSTSLHDLAWVPDGTPFYLYGFAQGPASDTADPLVTAPGFSTAKMKTLTGRRLDAMDLGQVVPRAFANSTAFLAVAVGDVEGDHGFVELDVWTIDENKRLTNVFNDCAR